MRTLFPVYGRHDLLEAPHGTQGMAEGPYLADDTPCSVLFITQDTSLLFSMLTMILLTVSISFGLLSAIMSVTDARVLPSISVVPSCR